MQLTLAHEPSAARPDPVPELKALVRLAAPLALAHFGQMLIGAVDTAVVGRLGEVELGAAGLGNTVFFTVAVLGLGIMLGIDPLVSQALGANEAERARRTLWQGLWLALLVGLPLTVAVLGLGAALELMGIPAVSAEHTRAYIYARVPSLLPFLAFVGARSYLQAVGLTRPMVIAVVVANLVNLPIAWALAFGDAGLVRFGLPALGVPQLGVAGAAWAATIATLFQLLIIGVAVRSVPGPATRAHRKPDRALIGKAVVLGLPIGLQMLAEFGIFGLVTVLMGNLSTRALAAHQVAITLASATFMIPVGIGAAASVRVGRAVGRADVPGTRLAGVVAIVAGGAFMTLAALAFLLAPAPLASIITSEPAVIEAVVPLLFVAAVFQLSDGVQAVAAGALRGAGDTRFALFANLGGHYLIGLPVGVVLAFVLGLGASGLWWGLSVGLTVVAIGLAVRFLRLSANAIARV
jgi:MATE family multidrug resistance protein